jgi:hypothetical protein
MTADKKDERERENDAQEDVEHLHCLPVSICADHVALRGDYIYRQIQGTPSVGCEDFKEAFRSECSVAQSAGFAF